jgi:hypothetical protein
MTGTWGQSFWNSGVTWSGAATTTQKKMNAKVALNLRGLDDREVLDKLQLAIDKLTTNAAQFPNPNPTLLIAQGNYDAADALLNQIDGLEQQLTSLRTQRDQKMEIARAAYGQLGAFVENKAGGDPAKISDGGFDVAQPPGATPPMPQVANHALTAGDGDGEADAAWDAVPKAKSYEYQTAANPAGPWTHEATVTGSKHSMSGKTSGQKLWGRVRAVNKLGPGAWSDPACCTVP